METAQQDARTDAIADAASGEPPTASRRVSGEAAQVAGNGRVAQRGKAALIGQIERSGSPAESVQWDRSSEPKGEPADPAEWDQPDTTQVDHPQAPRHARHGAIRTFHPRRGRASTTQADALDRLWARYGYAIPDPALDADRDLPPFDQERLFGRRAPLVLEIGCGMGEATAAMAAADPGRDYLGVDVHTPGLGNLIVLAESEGLRNVRVARGDVLDLLRTGLGSASLAGVHIFFPDPWPKAKHHKRRMIQPSIVALLRDRLAPGGVIHCATDWAEYAEQMLDVLAADPGLTNRYPDAGYAPRAEVGRPVTGYERRGIRDGRAIFDLVFERNADADQH